MRARSLNALLTTTVLLLGLVWFASPAFASAQKTTLCHVPPDDPSNAHEIVVSEKAIEAHLQNHLGDQVGTCPEQGCSSAGDCTDGNACTIDVCNTDGSCDFSQPVDCSDGDVCTMDACDTQSGCVNPPEPDDPQIMCNDGNACSDMDVCVAGSCTGTAIAGCCASDADCPASDACATRYCEDATSTCQEVDLSTQCTAGACEVAFCDPDNGGCVVAPAMCADDGDICTVAECNPNICGTAGGCETFPIPTPPEPGFEITCDDGLDNDCDGVADMNDPDCEGDECSEHETLIFGGTDYALSQDLLGAVIACHDALSKFSVTECGLEGDVICGEIVRNGECETCVLGPLPVCDRCKGTLTSAARAVGCFFDFNSCPPQ